MTKKIILSVLAVTIFLGIFLFLKNSGNKVLKPLPTKNNPSPSGLYTEVPPFDQWEWQEGKDLNGVLIYKIKLPPINTNYVVVEKYPVSLINTLSISTVNRDAPSYIYIDLKNSSSTNIEDFYLHSEKYFLRKWASQIPNANIGKYRSHAVENFQRISNIQYYFLTSSSLINLVFDYDENFLDDKSLFDNTSLGIDRELGREYMKIYLPIVEKALSTLEIPDYVDDRGFATSTEIKLLPDNLRVYEVK